MLYKTGVEYKEKSHFLEPYYLGIWLGDGSHNSTTIHKPNRFIESYVKELCQKMGLEYSLTGRKGDMFGHSLTKTSGKENPIIAELRRLNLYKNKHIPKEYLIDSRENRLQLLAGLLDTDGHLVKKPNGGGHYEIVQVRKELAEQIKELAESLGFYASLKEKTVTTKYGHTGTYYRVTIFGDIFNIPCKVDNKKATIPPQYNRKNSLRSGFTIQEAEVGDYVGIEIDGNNLFLLGDYQVVHNCKDADINKRWEVAQLTLSTGAGGRVHGFSIHTSTVGEMEMGGGEQFRELCEASMYGKRNANGQTASGLYILFIPAYDGLEGYVDEYGMSVIDTPTPEQEEFIGKNYGARQHIENTIAHLKTLPKKDKLLQFQREHPTTFRGCFRTNSKDPFFNIAKLEDRIDEIKKDPTLYTKGNFRWQGAPYNSKVIFEPNENGRFEMSYQLTNDRSNRVSYDPALESWVAENIEFCAGADPFKASKVKGKRKSNGGGAVYWGHDIRLDPFEKPIDEWKSCRFVCTYSYRPDTIEEYGDDMIMMCFYWGCPMYPETNVEFVRKWFEDHGCGGMLVHQFKNGKYDTLGGIDANERVKQKIFQLYQSQVERHCHRECHSTLLNEILSIKGVDDMTNWDLFAAGGYAMIGADNYLGDLNKERMNNNNSSSDIGDYYKQFM